MSIDEDFRDRVRLALKVYRESEGYIDISDDTPADWDRLADELADIDGMPLYEPEPTPA